MATPSLHPTFPLTDSALRAYRLPRPFNYQDIQKARKLIQRMKTLAEGNEQSPLYAGDLAAIGITGSILLQVMNRYLSQQSPDTLRDLDHYLVETIGQEPLLTALSRFLQAYPPPQLDPKDTDIESYLSLTTANVPNRQLLYQSILLVIIAHENQAYQPYQALFHQPALMSDVTLEMLSKHIEAYFRAQPGFHGEPESVLDFLRGPFREQPRSIMGQLQYIRDRWGAYLDHELLSTLSRGIDYLQEDHRSRELVKGAFHDPLWFEDQIALGDDDQQRFSQDEDWMSNVVLMAKHIYVWLDQLSKSYHREFKTLDQIPDQEFQRFARWGITGLWIIGIWERSRASKRIKNLCGNPDALPSAYSIHEYRIAPALGGEEAYQTLRARARKYGVRLAGDMVPNHMGIDSTWVREHPDWFLSLDHKPFPNYSYTGPDLSDSDELSVYIEDHYYDRSDAAVVFKRVNHRKGETRYIYHGNDGTSMPWNDTAQLNFLKDEVQEAVIHKILDVAGKVSIIRFDAAMTLTKKHYQRLWFPEPGSGGAIPTRSEFGLTKQEFNQRFPKEFWHKVVERLQAEKPDTLLIAEAFWMMEGYFVRNLGMHRVYNSAFMHMLRDEDNAQYRKVIKRTLAYDPRIMKRYVNFMNNPDEDTAVEQFGKGGKYFGVCVMMVTLPGLPLFGHGQVEGFYEKYGMEYGQAYYDEQPDPELMQRHRQEVFPLLKKRWLFSEVDNFVLFDFISDQDQVDENVFAYSNRAGDDAALVLYHNRWGETRGTIQPAEIAGQKSPAHVAEALGLDIRPGQFVLYRDQITGLEYIRPSEDILHGKMGFHLGAYTYHVFTDFRQTGPQETAEYAPLYEHLGEEGCPSLEQKRVEMRYLEAAKVLNELLAHMEDGHGSTHAPESISTLMGSNFAHDPELDRLLARFFDGVIASASDHLRSDPVPSSTLSETARQTLTQLSKVIDRCEEYTIPRHGGYSLILWALFSPLQRYFPPAIWLEMAKLIPAQAVQDRFDQRGNREHLTQALKILLKHQSHPLLEISSPLTTLRKWMDDRHIHKYLHINEYQGDTYYHQEGFEQLLDLLLVVEQATFSLQTPFTTTGGLLFLDKIEAFRLEMLHAHAHSGCKLTNLQSLLTKGG